MKLSVAPLIYSRTLKKGFSPNFLVYPEELNDLPNFRNWARSFVESALVKADYLADNCRICSFQNDDYIVVGICAVAEFLCENPNYHFVDKERRMNHGFFGYVFKKESFKPFFVAKCANEEIPPIFKELYRYVIKYWQDDESEAEKNSHPEPFQEINFDFEEPQPSTISLHKVEEKGTVCLPQEQYYPFFPQMISNRYSFCSNMPSIQDAGNSPFDYVFIPKLNRVEIAVKKSDFTVHRPENSPESQQLDGTEETTAKKQRELADDIASKLPMKEKGIHIVNTTINFFQKDILPGKSFLPKIQPLEEKTVSVKNPSAIISASKKPKQENPSPIISGGLSKKFDK